MSTAEAQKVLNPTVVKLGLVSLLADISSEMLYPITPVFLSTVLGASMASVGLVEGSAEAIASLLKAYSGQWSDHLRRRKPFIVAGYFLAAVAKPLVGSAGHWSQVLLARGLDRTGKGLRGGPRDALLAEAVSEKQRGAAFGWHRGMDTLGAALGPLIAVYYLRAHSQDLRQIFYWALIPGLLAGFLTLTLRESRASAAPAKRASSWNWSTLPTPFRKYLLVWGLFSLTNSSDVFLLLKTKQSGASLSETIFIYCFYNLIYAAFSPILGGLSDRWGRKSILLFGFMTFALVYGGFAVASERWQFWLLFGIYGLYNAATDGVGKAFAIDLVSTEQKATAIGMLGTVTGLAALVASVTAGFLWDHVGASSAFFFGCFGAVAAAASLSPVRSRHSV